MSIRKLPAVKERVETGVVQFGDDWPGIFIRGDNIFGLKIELETFVSLLKQCTEEALKSDETSQ